MNLSHSYLEQVNQAAQQLDMARTALPRDFAQAIESSVWSKFLRDRYDVAALVKQIGGMLEDRHFLDELHAAADKAREQQPRVGRPPKQAKEADRGDGAIAS